MKRRTFIKVGSVSALSPLSAVATEVDVDPEFYPGDIVRPINHYGEGLAMIKTKTSYIPESLVCTNFQPRVDPDTHAYSLLPLPNSTIGKIAWWTTKELCLVERGAYFKNTRGN